MKLTYGGNIIFEFPNFDLSIGGTPSFAGQGNGAQKSLDDPDADRRQAPTRIIVKNDEGYWWDGSNYFRSPNYRDDAFANANYLERVVGNPDERWPELTPPESRFAWSPPGSESPSSGHRIPGNASAGFEPTPTKSVRTLERMVEALEPPSFGTSPAAKLPVNTLIPGSNPAKLPMFPAPSWQGPTSSQASSFIPAPPFLPPSLSPSSYGQPSAWPTPWYPSWQVAPTPPMISNSAYRGSLDAIERQWKTSAATVTDPTGAIWP